jgi:hypothetical protein
MTIVPAGDGSSKKRASSHVGKSDAVKALYKPLKMTATLKRRARKKVNKQTT